MNAVTPCIAMPNALCVARALSESPPYGLKIAASKILGPQTEIDRCLVLAEVEYLDCCFTLVKKPNDRRVNPTLITRAILGGSSTDFDGDPG